MVNRLADFGTTSRIDSRETALFVLKSSFHGYVVDLGHKFLVEFCRISTTSNL